MTTKRKQYHRNFPRHNKTKKYSSSQSHFNASVQSKLISELLTFQTFLKLFHWNTPSYASHKASDQLYTDLGTIIDSFVEKLLGKYQTIHSRQAPLHQVKIHLEDPNLSVKHAENRVVNLKKILINMHFASENADLANIRDEMVGQLNQFMYLLKLD